MDTNTAQPNPNAQLLRKNVQDTSILLQRLLNSVRRDVNLDRLQAVIVSLKDGLKTGRYSGEEHAVVQYYLLKASLTRYALYWWIEDPDTCFLHLQDAQRFFKFVGTDGRLNMVEIQAASQSIKECRDSLRMKNLDALIRAAEATHTSYTEEPLNAICPGIDILLLLGNALVMKYLKDGDAENLDKAAARFQEAERICTNDYSRTYACLVSLAYIECLRFIDLGETNGWQRLFDYKGRAEAIDKEADDACYAGGTMANRSIDEAEFKLEEAIPFLRLSLQGRIPPHPRRWRSLHQLSDALHKWYNQRDDLDALEECVLLSREALALRILPHPDHALSLKRLSMALLSRFQRLGASQDLHESIMLSRQSLELHPPSHPDRPASLNNLAVLLTTQFGHQGSDEDVEEAIALCRESMLMTPPHHPELALSLNTLANALHSRFEKKGDFTELEESIGLHRQALDLRPTDHKDRPVSLGNLATVLFTRFEKKGDNGDLSESIQLHREELDLRRRSDRFLSLNNLANALQTRFELEGDLRDLEESIQLHTEAVELVPSPHIRRPSSLSNLAAGLWIRFRQEGVFQDLEHCIALYREALEYIYGPDRYYVVNNLAAALSTYFGQKGTVETLEEYINCYREALGLRHISSHPDHPVALENLASALSTRFELLGHIQDLNDCINLYREARRLCPDSYSLCDNLGKALLMRSTHTDSSQDLEECITLHREALHLRPRTHSHYTFSLRNLASALSSRFKKSHKLEDSSESVTLYKQALSLQPFPHPHRLLSLRNLADAFLERYKVGKNSSDIAEALHYYEEASKYEPGSVFMRFAAAWKRASCSREYETASALDAYHAAIELLPLLASLDLTLQQRQDVLQHSIKLAADAVKCAIDAHKYERAVEFLSTGRSVFWSQALQLHPGVDELKFADTELAEQFIKISRQLEEASYTGPRHISNSSIKDDTDRYTSLSTLVNQRRQIIGEIQKVQGFKGFLQLRSSLSLQNAIKGGCVVMLNASELECDALIMRETWPVVHVSLPEINVRSVKELKMLINEVIEGKERSSQDLVNVIRTLVGRDWVRKSSSSSSDEVFQMVLECLWVKVVQPIVKRLGLIKTDSPERIWWCPTGPFTSLPVHAAGLYSEDGEPIDCIFEYAVSSYCTSPQDLLHHLPTITPDFNMVTVIEPAVPGAGFLPATYEEMKVIEKHMPDPQHLLMHIGSKDKPNQVDNVLADIRRSLIVHFGCHGMQNLANPLESYLLLSAGKLTMSKIMKECQVTNGALAYLSACQTATGDEVRPDESLSLVATMMFAGFRSVVGTMWSIFDEDAPIVADIFYRHLF